MRTDYKIELLDGEGDIDGVKSPQMRPVGGGFEEVTAQCKEPVVEGPAEAIVEQSKGKLPGRNRLWKRGAESCSNKRGVQSDSDSDDKSAKSSAATPAKKPRDKPGPTHAATAHQEMSDSKNLT